MSDIVKAFRTEEAQLLIGDEAERLAGLAERVELVAARIAPLEVVTEQEAQTINDHLLEAKAAANDLERDRKARKQPILDEGRRLDACYAPVSAAFRKLEKEVKGKLAQFLRKKQEEAARRLAEATKAQEEAEAKRIAAIEAGNERAVAEASSALVKAHQERPVENVVSGVTSEAGKTSLRWKKVPTLIDITQVPREWLEIAVTNKPEELLRLVRKHGQPIPGVDLVEEQTLAARPGTF